MSELKTLKDIANNKFKTGHSFAVKIILFDDLRQEAIKWVKTCPHRQFNWEHLKEFPLRCSTCLMMIDFFNLTNEDLK